MTSTASAPAFLQGGGAMGERIRNFDWASHPLGEPTGWPEALKMAMSLCLGSSFPTAIYWGPELFTLYNDAWSPIPADRHPAALGRPARELWSDIWDVVGPQFEQVWTTGEGIALYEQMLPMERHGEPQETWWNYSFTALRHADNNIGGIFNQGNEVTALVLARRRRQAEIERWRELFRQAPAPVAFVTGEDHVFEVANDAYRALVGGRDILGRPVREALPEVVDQGFLSLLDQVRGSGQPYVGNSVSVKLQHSPEEPAEDRVLDFVYQPVRNATGAVDGIFVLATDVTERAKAEAALRLTNWQLSEERARLASTVEAERRAREALRKMADSMEAYMRSQREA
ncbi:PAS domain-containing protein [Ramlibacter albus]|uniref:PAS domain-containing protein n=1 Tax=Ramlibacter albus TaxID=2079448 RepID=A0A923M879_9BURK|nr:PAS domain-containing protein [Ramlibacter albus]MBC5764519.1 PAS domain-containing protein [Ramlibacter albus]